MILILTLYLFNMTHYIIEEVETEISDFLVLSLDLIILNSFGLIYLFVY